MSHLIDIAAITSFEGVLAELKQLDTQLDHDNLNQLRTFNTAYAIITRAIKDAVADNYFKKPVFIEQFTVRFASYYFQAINDMTAGSSELPEAWAKLRDIREPGTVPLSITLLMGANAHINHDLPVAMASYINEGTDYSLSDARKVDKILMKCGKQIIPAFNEPSKLLNTLKYYLRYLYYHPVMYWVLIWRIFAWRNFRAIQENAPASHTKRSILIANRLLRLGRCIRFLAK